MMGDKIVYLLLVFNLFAVFEIYYIHILFIEIFIMGCYQYYGLIFFKQNSFNRTMENRISYMDIKRGENIIQKIYIFICINSPCECYPLFLSSTQIPTIGRNYFAITFRKCFEIRF